MFFIKKNFLQIIQSAFFLILLNFTTNIFSQTTYIPLGDKENDVLERLEIKTRVPDLFFSNAKPYSRKAVAADAEMIDSMLQANPNYAGLTKVDRYNLDNLLMENSDWTKPRNFYLSKNGSQGLYKTKDNLAEINNKNFFLALNPVLGFEVGKESSNSNTLYQTSYGFTLRGKVTHAFGFNFYVVNNEERFPVYIDDWILTHKAVPGAGNFTTTSTGLLPDKVSWLDARGYVTANITKHIDVQFGYDKNFIGDGYRSLLLSDFSAPTLFLKIDTRIWKFNYENLFMELYTPHNSMQSVGNKYARMYDLSININKWLNVGAFESIIFTRNNYYDIAYTIPVMFLRPAESNQGSGDNANVGFHAKANISGRLQLYGQMMLDEFVLSDFASSNGYWDNKQGYQLGLKYADAFGLKNVDLQAEFDEVRPYSYSHFDSTDNYTHYNQPLAHPLGANFKEFIGIIKAQPLPRLYINVTAIHYFQGLDSAGLDFGSNPFITYNNRVRNFGIYIGDGDRATANIFSATVSYELKENMFFDISGFYRTYNLGIEGTKNTTSLVNIGFRWNFARQEYNF